MNHFSQRTLKFRRPLSPFTAYSLRSFNTNNNAGRFRNTYRGKKVFVKPHNIIRDHLMLAVTPHRAIYEESNNTVSLSRLGYLTFEFIPTENVDGRSRANYQDKDTFIMTMKNIGDFLKIDDSYNKDEEPVILNYVPFNSPQSGPDSRVTVCKIEKKLIKEDGIDILNFEITYMYIRGEEITKDRSILIEVGEMKVLQSLLEQSMFYLLGWQVLGTPQILESDIDNRDALNSGKFSPFKKN